MRLFRSEGPVKLRLGPLACYALNLAETQKKGDLPKFAQTDATPFRKNN